MLELSIEQDPFALQTQKQPPHTIISFKTYPWRESSQVGKITGRFLADSCKGWLMIGLLSVDREAGKTNLAKAISRGYLRKRINFPKAEPGQTEIEDEWNFTARARDKIQGNRQIIMIDRLGLEGEPERREPEQTEPHGLYFIEWPEKKEILNVRIAVQPGPKGTQITGVKMEIFHPDINGQSLIKNFPKVVLPNRKLRRLLGELAF